MAAIDSYPVDGTISNDDLVIGSNNDDSNVTVNFKIGDISDFTRGNTVLSDVTSVTSQELSILSGATLSTAQLNILTGATVTSTELNILDGALLTTQELNFVDGVTSNIQTQIDAITSDGGVLLSYLEQDGATDRQLMNWDDDNTTWAPTTLISDDIPRGISGGEASGFGSLSWGLNSSAEGSFSISIGEDSSAVLDSSTALGGLARATGAGSVSIGRDTESAGGNSIALAGDSRSPGEDSTALGYIAKANGDKSTAIGTRATATDDNTIVLGTTSEEVRIPGDFVVTGDSTMGDSLKLTELTANPTYAASTHEGTIHYNTTDFKFYGGDNDSWVDLSSTGGGDSFDPADDQTISGDWRFTGLFALPSLSANPTGEYSGQQYYNFTDDEVRVYDAGTTTWTAVGGTPFDYTADLTLTKTDPTIILKSDETADDDNEVGKLSFEGLSGTSNNVYAETVVTALDESAGEGEYSMRINNGTSLVDRIVANDSYMKIGMQESSDTVQLVFDESNRILSVYSDRPQTGATLSLTRQIATPTDESVLGVIGFANGSDTEGVNAFQNSITARYIDSDTTDFQFQHRSGGVNTTSLFLGSNDANYSALPLRIGANASANELDDYEEGTWTPSPTVIGGETVSNQSGTYRKVGNIVVATIRFTIAAVAAAGPVNSSIQGLPFVPNAASLNSWAGRLAEEVGDGNWTTVSDVEDLHFANNQNIRFFKRSLAALQVRDFSGSITYTTDS